MPKVSKMRSPDERPKNDLGVILGEWNRKWKLLFRAQGLGFRDDVGCRVLGLGSNVLGTGAPNKGNYF